MERHENLLIVQNKKMHNVDPVLECVCREISVVNKKVQSEWLFVPMWFSVPVFHHYWNIF